MGQYWGFSCITRLEVGDEGLDGLPFAMTRAIRLLPLGLSEVVPPVLEVKVVQPEHLAVYCQWVELTRLPVDSFCSVAVL